VYLPERMSGLRVVSAEDPDAPVDVGRLDESADSKVVRVEGQYAYLVDAGTISDTLRIVSVADPRRPAVVGETPLSWPAICLSAAGDYVYLAGWGLSTVSVGDKSAPTELGYELDVEAQDARSIDSGGGHVFLTEHDRVRIFSIDDPARPVQVSEWNRLDLCLLRLIVSGPVAMSPRGVFGIAAYDAETPQEPVELGTYETYGDAHDITVDGDLVYVAAGAEGLVVLRMSPVQRPVEPAAQLYLPSLGLAGQ